MLTLSYLLAGCAGAALALALMSVGVLDAQILMSSEGPSAFRLFSLAASNVFFSLILSAVARRK